MGFKPPHCVPGLKRVATVKEEKPCECITQRKQTMTASETWSEPYLEGGPHHSLCTSLDHELTQRVYFARLGLTLCPL